MSNLVEEIIKGRKVFFIAPDKSLIPEVFLEEYLNLGYECYFVDSDIFLPVRTKVDIILSIFKDCIIFYNIDYPIQNDSWKSLILDLKNKYPMNVFGIIYAKRQSLSEKEYIEKTYLFDIGLRAGCIALEYQKKNNFGLIEKVLFANQAMGRRKSVRAVCRSNCSFQFKDSDGNLIAGKLADISISHFSFILPVNYDTCIKEFSRVEDIAFIIKGTHMRNDAVVFTTREVEDGKLFVMAFATKDGQSGLTTLNKQIMIPKLYEIMQENCSELLGKLFQTAHERRSRNLSAAAQQAATEEAIDELKKS